MMYYISQFSLCRNVLFSCSHSEFAVCQGFLPLKAVVDLFKCCFCILCFWIRTIASVYGFWIRNPPGLWPSWFLIQKHIYLSVYYYIDYRMETEEMSKRQQRNNRVKTAKGNPWIFNERWGNPNSRQQSVAVAKQQWTLVQRNGCHAWSKH